MNIDDLNTGDILLFSNNKTLFERAIQFFTHSIYTHVAMVVKDPPGFPGLHIIESSREPMPDEINNRKVFGVQMQPLEAALKTNGENVVVRKLMINRKVKQHFTKKVFDIVQKIYAKPYDINLLDWLRAELRVLDPKLIWEQQDHSFWCSALVAYIYVKLEFLPKNLPWTLISPDEWSKDNTLQFKDCFLSDIQQISSC